MLKASVPRSIVAASLTFANPQSRSVALASRIDAGPLPVVLGPNQRAVISERDVLIWRALCDIWATTIVYPSQP